MRLKDVGWAWEGHGLDPGVPPSIFGAGEGARFFGLRRGVYMFHPNTALAMEKMAHLDEVVCDISKWEFEFVGNGKGAVRNVLRGDPAITRAEAENVSRLSTRFPNISGAFIDDMDTLINNHGYGPGEHAATYEALRSHNPYLRLWAVVYAHRLDPGYWAPYADQINVANLWVWRSEDLAHLDEYVDRCRAIFPEQPINVGCYLRDYTLKSAVPRERMQFQFERIARYLDEGKIAGFSILAGCLIDVHPDEARWVRDFIAGH
jgi:hypothetical protein